MTEYAVTAPSDLAAKVAEILTKIKDEPGLNETMALLTLSQESAVVSAQLKDDVSVSFSQYSNNSR